MVHEVLNAEEQCDNTHKVFCDLLAELIKFNKVRIFLSCSSCFDRVCSSSLDVHARHMFVLRYP